VFFLDPQSTGSIEQRHWSRAPAVVPGSCKYPLGCADDMSDSCESPDGTIRPDPEKDMVAIFRVSVRSGSLNTKIILFFFFFFKWYEYGQVFSFFLCFFVYLSKRLHLKQRTHTSEKATTKNVYTISTLSCMWLTLSFKFKSIIYSQTFGKSYH